MRQHTLLARFLVASLVAASQLAVSGWAFAAAPKPFRAEYSALRNGEKLGVATIGFSARPGGRFELLTATRGSEGLAAVAGVSIEERSVLAWAGNRPETVSYRYLQQVAWKNRERRVDVDAPAGKIIRSDKNGSQVLRYQPGVLDRHAVTVALMQDLAAGKTGDLLYAVPEREGVVSQRYRPSGIESLDTSLGRQRVIRVERIRDDGNGRSTVVWFGVDRQFLPLRILQTEPNGDSIELRISAIR